MALFPAQVELLRKLLAASTRLAGASLEIGTPALFHQRECLAAVISLTRSHTHRAVHYGERPEDILRALTRPVERLILVGDPGTLTRRAQWQGPLDHLDAESAGREQAIIEHLAAYLQGRGPFPDTYHLEESGVP
jgi:hypothetical protein